MEVTAAFGTLTTIHPVEGTTEVLFGLEYRFAFGFSWDYLIAGDAVVYLRSDEDETLNEVFTSFYFARDSYFDIRFGQVHYGATIETPMVFFVDEGEYYFQTEVELEDGTLLIGHKTEFNYDYQKYDIALSDVSLADPVVEGDGDLWFALNVDNNSTLEQVSDYTLQVWLGAITASVWPEEPAYVFTIDNFEKGSSSREIVRLKLGELEQPLEVGSYGVLFAIEPADDVNELEWDFSDNVGADSFYVLPQDVAEKPREAGDFDGDRVEDVLFFNASTGGVGQFGMPTGDWSSLGRAGAGWVAKGTGHFDEDDDAADVLWFNELTRNVGRFDLSETGSSWGGLGKAGVGWEVAGAGDFNGDGTDDILWLNTLTNAVGQFQVTDGSSSWSGIGRSGSVWEFSGIGDFNGDGRDDVLWYNKESGALGQYRMNDGSMSWVNITTLGQGYQAVANGDFNNDGTSDILVFRESSRELGYFDMAGGEASWTGAAKQILEVGYTIQGTGDFDGDGNDDIMLRHSDGTVERIVMDGVEYGFDVVGSAGTDWDVI